jgi:hypothetical protein
VEDLVTVPGDRKDEVIDRAYGVGDHATASTLPPGLVNRRGAILTLGIIQIVLGAIFGLLTLGTVIMAATSGRAPMAIAGLIYGIPTANLLLTGIGSVRLAPWARRATLISAFVWLGFVIVLLGGMAIATGFHGFGMGRGEMAIVGVVMVPMFVLWLALPIVLIVVYTRPSVRATFDRGRAG